MSGNASTPSRQPVASEAALGSGPVRVFHVGLGAMGLAIARALTQRSGFEPVGAVSHQAGEDLGNLIGAAPLGPVAVELPESPPDAELCIVATASTLPEVEETILWALSHGMNVIGCAEELTFPDAADPAISHALRTAAERAGRTVLGTGINPGYAMDVLPICLTAPCLEVRSLNIRRVNDLSPYGPAVLGAFGVGLSPDAFQQGVASGRIVGHHGFAQSIALIAQAVGFQIDEVRQELQPIIAKSVRTGRDLTIQPGTVAGCLVLAEAFSEGRLVIRMEHPQEVDPAAEGVATGDFIDIDGDPPIHARIEPEIAGGVGTAALVVNMASRVVSAPAGMLTMNQMGLPSASSGRQLDSHRNSNSSDDPTTRLANPKGVT